MKISKSHAKPTVLGWYHDLRSRDFRSPLARHYQGRNLALAVPRAGTFQGPKREWAVPHEIDHRTPMSDDVSRSGSARPVRLAPHTTNAPRDLLTSNTSLDDLFNAILGDDEGATEERRPLVETVEAQVREIRQELGLVEPKPASRRLPEFVPVFRTQPPEERTFSSAQGTQWTVTGTRGWAGLIDGRALRRMPRALLLAVPAATMLFIAGIYLGTPSDSSLPTPPALLAAPQTANPNSLELVAQLAATDTPILAETIDVVSVTEPSVPAPPPREPDAPRPAAFALPVAATGSRAAAEPRNVAPRAIATTPPSAPPLPAPAPPVALVTPRPIETAPVAAPIGTAGTNTPVAVATNPQPVAQPTPVPSVASTPAPATVSATEPAPATAAPVPSPALPAGVASAPATVPGGGRVTREAILVSRVPPVYPELARRLGTTGEVELDVEIDPAGRVVRAAPVSGPRTLRDAAESAVLQWRYQPQLTDGAAVASRRRVRVSFK